MGKLSNSSLHQMAVVSLVAAVSAFAGGLLTHAVLSRRKHPDADAEGRKDVDCNVDEYTAVDGQKFTLHVVSEVGGDPDASISATNSEWVVRPQRTSSLSTSNGDLKSNMNGVSRQQTRRALDEASYISEAEIAFKGNTGFDDLATKQDHDGHTASLLRKTRAVSALGNRLMAAPDEDSCYEEITRLMVILFDFKKVAFGMLTETDYFLLKRVVVVRHDKRNGEAVAGCSFEANSNSFDLEYLNSDDRRPLAGTACGVCTSTMKEQYFPDLRTSQFSTHQVLRRNGMNSVLCVPILVNGSKCCGAILLCRPALDGFSKQDRVLLADMALLLGANIYAKRMVAESAKNLRRQRDMLQSVIPPQVLDKIEVFWNEDSEEYKSRQSTRSSEASLDESSYASTNDKMFENDDVRSNSWYVSKLTWDDFKEANGNNGRGGLPDNIDLIRDINQDDSNLGRFMVSTDAIQIAPCTKALYAESAKDVCIIFTDIVGFSRIAMDVKPIQVMDMLQNIFSRFDELCDVHDVLKLETIGDAYLCTTNLLEDGDSADLKDAARRALEMAKDMVVEATKVRVPLPGGGFSAETLQIRVGMHVGDLHCGVVGQRLPKFTTCGTTVNMAARMEQTSMPGKIRVSKTFHDLIGDAEQGWGEQQTIEVKNMGEVETYLLDPVESRIIRGCAAGE